MLTEYLSPEGFEIDSVHDGESGVARILESIHDLVVLDVMLQRLNGFEVLKRVRRSSAVPVIMLTARGDDVDRIVGLEVGADDYLAKPFNPRELVARLRAILRRTRDVAVRKSAPALSVGRIILKTGTIQVEVDGQAVKVTGAEFRVLETLMKSAGQVVSRGTLTEQALGRKLTLYDRSVDTHVSNLRRKLGQAGLDSMVIKNVRGAGYILTVPEIDGGEA